MLRGFYEGRIALHSSHKNYEENEGQFPNLICESSIVL